jgi:hypothetical protein
MRAEQILRFRFARSGLAGRDAETFAEAVACPASDFARDAALLALAARRDGVARPEFDDAVDRGADIVVAHVLRGAIHALAPDDLALYGRALIATDEEELLAQLGTQVQRLARDQGFAATDALAKVAEATKAALSGGRALSKNELHDELRDRVGADLLPWCKGCQSHHVAPMMWRYATVKAGTRLDSERRYLLHRPGRGPAGGEAVKRFLHFYGPATPGDFADWTGVSKPHARRLWERVHDELSNVTVEQRTGWALQNDVAELDSPPEADGVRLIPPGDPYLQRPNRSLLAPDSELRKRLFRPVASPGAVFDKGRLAGLWRVKAKGTKLEFTVEKLARIRRRDLDEEVQRVAAARGASEVELAVE